MNWALERGEQFGHCLLGEPTSVSQLGDTIKNGVADRCRAGCA